ncbi:MAG: PDZ domain-containing protein [Planctomycetota bacterium]|jgi:hypothetical protein
MRTVLAFLLMLGVAAAQDELARALAALRTAPRAEYDARIRAVLDLQPAPGAVVQRLRAGFAVEAATAGWHLLEAEDEEGVRRPFQLYVPQSVAGKTEPVALLVHLHGGVSRSEFLREQGQVGYGRLWVESAEAAGFVVAFPMGRFDCTWWSDTGVRHIRAMIREVKRRVPVDDDAIVGTGFSDGGSGCFYLAMAAPDPFAAFLPMNGTPVVAASASGKQVYLRNMKMTPQFAAMTQDDQLYPAARVLAHLHLALSFGAPIRIVSYESGNHRPVYFEDQRAAFVRFLTDTPRDPHPQEIDWWCADAATGRVAWVEILEIGPAAGDADALPDLNVTSTPGRVRLGFRADRSFAGEGVRVENVVEGTTAQAIGLLAGDVVVGLDGTAIKGLADLVAALQRKGFDQPVRLAVRRGDTRATLEGRIPPFVPRPWYARAKPTARLSLRVEGNRIRATSRSVRRFKLHLAPDLFAPGPVEVVVNGRPADTTVEALPLPVILRRYAEHADAGRVFTRGLTVSLPPR